MDKKKDNLYKHYKGTLYNLIMTGTHSETGEEMVVYQSMDTGLVWIRPSKMFFEEVTFGGKKIPRFQKVE